MMMMARKLPGAYVLCYMSCRLKINLVLSCIVLMVQFMTDKARSEY